MYVTSKYANSCAFFSSQILHGKKKSRSGNLPTSNKDFFESAASTVRKTPAGFGALVSLLNTVGQVFLPDAVNLARAGY